MKYFLITTEHLETGLWFVEDEDYKTGVNYVAIVSFLTGVKILAFILMSNHVHFLVACNGRKDAEAFIAEFKKRYSFYLSRKRGIRELLRDNPVDIREVFIGDESFERAVAYIQMNCVAANICLTPAEYPWGTGNCFFKLSPTSGRKLGALSARAKRVVLHTTEALPDQWILTDSGFIAPDSFVDINFTESIFRTPKRMNYFLLSSSKAKKQLLQKESSFPSFRDDVLSSASEDICRSLFQKRSITELTEEQKAVLIWHLKSRLGADVTQIARITRLDYSAIAKILEEF